MPPNKASASFRAFWEPLDSWLHFPESGSACMRSSIPLGDKSTGSPSCLFTQLSLIFGTVWDEMRNKSHLVIGRQLCLVCCGSLKRPHGSDQSLLHFPNSPPSPMAWLRLRHPPGPTQPSNCLPNITHGCSVLKEIPALAPGAVS